MITSIIIGGIAGWIAGKVMKSDKSIIFNIILGIAGGVIGSFALSIIGLTDHGLIGSLVSSTLSAVIIIYLGRIILKR